MHRSEQRLAPSVEEVKQLWWFRHSGSIMAPDTRAALRNNWGLCARHAWLYAAMEIELFAGLPLSTAILYEDLVGTAARAVGRRLTPWPVLRRRLQGRGFCFTCDFVEHARADGNASFRARRDEMAGLQRTTRRLVDTRALWSRHSCPACGGDGSTLCRRHVCDRGSSGVDRDALGAYLSDLDRRLWGLIRSMTHGGRPAEEPKRSSWIEALGWTNGWSIPLKIVEAAA